MTIPTLLASTDSLADLGEPHPKKVMALWCAQLTPKIGNKLIPKPLINTITALINTNTAKHLKMFDNCFNVATPTVTKH